MTEFLVTAFVAFIILFGGIQMAALDREASALGELSYQAARWATNPGNNSIVGSNSPQCSDVVNLLKGVSVSPYASASNVMVSYVGLPRRAGSA
jgi:hypothetical protein